jgi:hypothetical protein
MTQTDDARWPDRAFLFDYDLQDEAGNWKTLRGWSETPPDPMQSKEYTRADLSTQPVGAVKVKPLVWDFDGRKLRMDDTMAFSKSYDWDGYECFRQEGYGLGCGYIIWPDKIGGSRWSLYGMADGLFVTDITSVEAAKAAAQADYEARILSALEPDPLADPRVVALEKALRDAGDYIGKGRPQMAQNIIRNAIAALETGGKDG